MREAILRQFAPKKLALIALGAAICTFGIHNIHSRVGVTEGGVIGLMLLLQHWLHLPAGLITFVLDGACYLLAWRVLGGGFLVTSIFSTAVVSLFYSLWEALPYCLPDLSARPLLAAVAGAAFVGLGVGLIVRQGGSSGGDDALALCLEKLTKKPLSLCYLATDLTVLLLSLSYIPLRRIAFSLVTVTISSLLIDRVKSGFRARA